jgi:peptidoglycan/LPS O-acetylase OafA/YrhL
LVVLAHATVPGFDGGWIGVDVFFVLSGYLITHILLQHNLDHPFSYKSFLIKRLRRLAPAFVATGVLSLVVFAAILPNRIFIPATQTLAWSALGIGNIQQSLGTSYFADDGSLNPYTHLWSLGVEKQFYLFLPILFFGFSKWRRYTVFLLLCIMSYLALKENQYNPAAYFWPWTRAWELLTGALLAMTLHHAPKLQGAGWVGDLGIVVVLLSAFMGNKDGVDWPFFAFLAALGTVAFIGSKPGIFGKVLSWKPIVAVGVASYSIYLVHQPILVFAKTWTGGYPISTTAKVATIVAILAIGLSLHRYVEKPFLEGKIPFGLQRMTIAYVSLFAMAFTATSGYWTDTRTTLARLWGGGTSIEHRITKNLGASPHPVGYSPTQKTSTQESQSPNIHLWGDSHAMHSAQALLAAGIPHQQWTLSMCTPTNGIALIDKGGNYNLKWAKKCARFNSEVLDFLLSQEIPGTVILVSAMWTVDRTNTRAWDDRAQQEISIPHGYERVERALEEPVRALRAKGWNVVTISPNLRWKYDPGRCNAIMAWMGRDPEVHCRFPALSDTLESERHQQINKILQRYSETGLTQHVQTLHILCPNNICLSAREGVFIWRDKDHLSREGSYWLGQQEAFQNAIRKAVYGETPIRPQ